MKMKGYTGKILTIDLSDQTYQVRSIPDEVYEQYLSGLGLGVYYLYNNLPTGCDPLGPDNILGFVSGLLTGTGSLTTGRWMAVCKSPLTGGWGDANCGGTLSPAIKRCGYDAIFVRGTSPTPISLVIGNETVQFVDASDLWGVDAIRSEEDLIATYQQPGRRPNVAVIGTAGEKRSLIAGICHSGGRIAARSGVGAVMGSKKLKALVLVGNQPIRAADPKAIKSISKQYAQAIRQQKLQNVVSGWMFPALGRIMMGGKIAKRMDGMLYAALLKKWGTVVGNTLGMYSGDSPIKNWRGSVKDYPHRSSRKMNPDLITQQEIRKYTCFSCAISCGGICHYKDPHSGKILETHKPEYETVNAFGALLLNTDLNTIFQINDLLNRAGMDTISAGGAVAFAMECYQHGILNKADLDGIDLRWGNSEAILAIVKKMIQREGIGDILADGVRLAAERIGPDTAQFAIHAGGQEPGMHDARLDPQLGLHYSADPTPGRHTIGSGLYYNMMQLWQVYPAAPKPRFLYTRSKEFRATQENTEIAVLSSAVKMVLDGSGGCLFALLSGLHQWRLFEYLNAATGWDRSVEEYLVIGKRIQTLRQAFNIREGLSPGKISLHSRALGTPALKEGPLRRNSVPINDMKKAYWKAYGWDENSGIPTKQTLQELNLDTFVKLNT